MLHLTCECVVKGIDSSEISSFLIFIPIINEIFLVMYPVVSFRYCCFEIERMDLCKAEEKKNSLHIQKKEFL